MGKDWIGCKLITKIDIGNTGTLLPYSFKVPCPDCGADLLFEISEGKIYLIKSEHKV
jgi:hypothetical protein